MKQRCAFLLLLLCSTQAFAQLPPACTINNPPMAKTCSSACILCELNGYTSATTQTVQGQIIPGYCTQVVHSMGYIGFVAGSTNLSIEVTIGACTIGNSIEMGIYQTDNCQTFTLVGDCNTAMFTGNSYTLSNTEPLVPGCPYFLVTDNNGPAACAFTVAVTNGSASAPPVNPATVPVGPTNVCPGATVEYTIPPIFGACHYRWTAPAGTTINGLPSPVTLNNTEGTTVTVTWGSQGGQLCVRGSNPCAQGVQACLPVTVGGIPPTVLPPVSICAGDSYEWIDGNFYASTQLLSYTYVTPLGCDSIVRRQLIVRPPIISNLGVLRVCEGSCVSVGSGSYCTTGSFQEMATAANGCDSTIFFSVLVVQTAAVIGPADTLSCIKDTITLNSNGSTPGGSYIWQDSSGNVLSTADTLRVYKPGLYRLIVQVTAAGLTCRDTAVTIVFSNQQLPNLSASGDSLNCTEPIGQLQATSTTPGVSYAWSGPGGFQSTIPNPAVSAPGTYLISVSAPNGCVRTDSVEVLADLTAPILITSVSDTLTCLIDSVLLSAQSNLSGTNFLWSGPQGFSSSQADTSTITPGQYTLIATAPNGCTATDSLMVLSDTIPPILTVSGDTLTCLETSVVLNAVFSPQAAVINWSGPQNFSSSLPNPSVQVSGIYQAMVTTANGCTAAASAEVIADTIPPQVTATGGTLTCSQDSLNLSSTVQPVGSTLAWAGPLGFISNLPDPVVNIPGNYTLTATANNGCTAAASTLVNIDSLPPLISAQGDTLTCTQNDGMLSLTFSPVGSSIAWTGPQSFSSTQANPTITNPGLYSVTVTAPNGCTASAQVNVLADASIPQVSASGGTITCSQTSVLLAAQVTPAGSNIAWTGPMGFSSTLLNPTALIPGQYFLTASTANGCTATAGAEVLADTSAPTLTLSGGTISCDQPSISLGAVFAPNSATISWLGPQGFSSMLASPNTSFSGNYSAVVTAQNGCTAQANLQVPADTTAPLLSATGGTLNCTQTSISLASTVNPAGAGLLWTGPQSFSSTQPNPSTSIPGNYQLLATAANGCTASANATVSIDTLAPQVNASGGALTCSLTAVPISATVTPANAQVLWTGPQAFSSTLLSTNVSTSGTYNIQVTAANGCTATSTATVLIDTISPQVSASGGLLTCIQNSLSLTASVMPANSQLLWMGPQSFSSSQLNPVVSVAGNYVLTATASNGCTGTASAVVTADSDFPVVSASGGTINCTQNAVVLMSSVSPGGTNLSWSGPQSFNSTQPNPMVSIGGIYTLTATTPAGCSATATTSVQVDTLPPQLSATGAQLNCQQPAASITANVLPASSTLLWSGPQNFISTLASPAVNFPGQYLVTATGPNGCTATASALVMADTSLPQILAAGGVLTCLQPQIQLSLALQPSGSTVLWSGPQGFSSTQQQPSASLAGVYTVVATALNGCTATATAQVSADNSLPVLSASGGVISCTQPSINLSSTVNPMGGVLMWTGPQNFSSNLPNPAVTSPGIYTLTATLPNGCAASTTASVSSDLATPEIKAGAGDITCREPQASLNATVKPLNSSVLWSGPQNFSSTALTPTVAVPGTYTLVATAPNGCTKSTSVVVAGLNQPNWTLSLGPDIEVEEFEPIFPHPVTDLPIEYWAETSWEFPAHALGIPCTHCQLPVLKLAESGNVTVHLADSNGCVQSASYHILVQQTSAIYIPNIFNPEGQADNQLFGFHIGAAARVVEVRQFRIFDRWGNLVHERPPFQANDPAHGWDGFIKGKKALPGVYVWYAEFEFANGRIKLLKGDVTLYR